jgi:hypothetical protein
MIMRNLKSVFGLLLAIAMLATVSGVLVSCDDDDDPPAELELTGLTAGGIDLNGATSPTNVPADAAFSATFSTELDPTSVTTSNITLTRDYDDAVLDIAVSATGNTVTVTPAAALGSGTLYLLNFGTGLTSTADKTLASAVSRSFTTEGTFSPAGVLAHWTFEDNADDVVGDFDPEAAAVVDVTYVDSRNAAAGKAALFNGTTTIIEIPNGDQFMESGDFTVSFWMKADATKEGHFVFGLAAWYGFQFEILGGSWDATDKGVKLATRYQLESTTDAEDTWWNGNPNGWQGSVVAKDVSASGGIATYFKDKWAHVVCSYNKAEKVGTMYVNGEKVREWDFDLWPDDSAKKGATGVTFAGNTTDGGNNFAIGFIQASGNRIVTDTWADPADIANSHFKGELDDLRIFSVPVTETEVSLMYNSEKP